MIIIWGSRMYGKVDVVPGLFHVETKFGHLWYIPLFPVETYVVLNKDNEGWNGVKIPLSPKSIIYAWLRAGTLVAGIIGFGRGLGGTPQGEPGLGHARDRRRLVPGVSFAILTFHRGSTHASYDRACELGEIVGLNQEGREMIESAYGMKDDHFGRNS